MKILFFTEHLAAGGKERQIVELLKGLCQYDHVKMELVLTKPEIHYEEIYKLKIPIHIIKRKVVKKDPRLFFLFFGLARKFKPDIIHVFGHMPAVYSIPAKLLLGIPLVNNEIQDSSPLPTLIAKDFVFKNSDRIIGNSLAGLKAYHIDASKSAVIYNGFSFARLQNLPDVIAMRSKFGITTTYVIGMIASFNKFKDYDTYINAAITLVSQRSDVSFLCIGNGDDRVYREMVTAKKVKNIHFLGKQSQVEAIMNLCDVGVLTTFGEGISNALMEFMALGKPVVATDKGGTIELIEDTVTGFLINVAETERLIELINRLLANANERIQVGRAASERIKNSFSNEVMVTSFYNEYRKLIQQRSAS